MAIVFISAKERQKTFFMAISIMLVIFMIAVSLLVFLSKPKPVYQGFEIKNPEILINFGILESDIVKNLQPFDAMEKQFFYTATTIKGKQVSGKVAAETEEDAKEILEGMGYFFVSVKESSPGRENPFKSYY